MIYVLSGVSIIYAILSAFASAVGLKEAKLKDTHLTMMCGGITMLAATAALLLHWQYDFILAVIGGALISAAALVNGIRGESFHLSHHIVRFFFTVVMTVGYIAL